MKKKTITILVIVFVVPFFMDAAAADHNHDDAIPYFELLGVKTKDVDKSGLNNLNEKIAAIFIFKRPCLICAKNITFWNRLSSIYKEKIKVFGIVLDASPEKAADLLESKIVRFDIYIPKRLERMITVFEASSNLSQTILYKDKTIVYHKIGDLNAQDYFEIAKIIKGE